MKRKSLLSILIALLAMGCSEVDYMLFNDVARVQIGKDKSLTYSFFYEPSSKIYDTVYMTVNTIGYPVGVDRPISIKQVREYAISYEYDKFGAVTDTIYTEYTNYAKSGTHYLPFESKEMQEMLVIKANEVSTQVPIILLRDESLKDSTHRLCIELQSNSEFQLGERNNLKFTIIFSDRVEKPNRWNSSVDKYYFGVWSLRKHLFMYETVNELIDDEWLTSIMLDYGQLNYYVDKFKTALRDYNADPENIANGLAPMREKEGDSTSPLIIFP